MSRLLCVLPAFPLRGESTFPFPEFVARNVRGLTLGSEQAPSLLVSQVQKELDKAMIRSGLLISVPYRFSVELCRT